MKALRLLFALLINKLFPKKPLIVLPGIINAAAQQLIRKGHQVLVVGGAVRDAIKGITPKDFDIEVYGINYNNLVILLSDFGVVSIVGSSFGIIKLYDNSGNHFDFSIPRRENRIGQNHTSFMIEFDENMTPKEASLRRDFTVNALMYDLATGKILDFHDGLEDLELGILTAVSSKFSEDPLRIYRGMQMQSRFDMLVHPGTLNMMTIMYVAGDTETLSIERIAEEWMKWATKGMYPDLLFYYLWETGLIHDYPALSNLKHVKQDHVHHPEGDVEIHTEYAMMAAVNIAQRENLTGDDRAVLMFAALLHDCGKPSTTTTELVNGKQVIHAYGHDVAGVEIAGKFLVSIGIKRTIIDRVLVLVRYHMAHIPLKNISDAEAHRYVRRLATKMGPSSITELLYIMEADRSGRPPLEPGLGHEGWRMKVIAANLKVELKPEQDILMGRHLIELGYTPGLRFGAILKNARNAQDEGEFNDVPGALIWLQTY